MLLFLRRLLTILRPCSLPLAVFLVAGCTTPPPSPSTETAPPVFQAAKLAELDRALHDAITARQLPGGVLWLESRGDTHVRAYGNFAVEPTTLPARPDALYDLASLTKVLATAPSVLRLVEEGRLELDAPVARYLPAFAAAGKEAITLRQLLTHTSGLRAGLPRSPAWTGPDAAFALAAAQPPVHAPGSAFLYSDVNFIVLGALVRAVSGETLDTFAARHFFAPLGMRDTRFRPAPTDLSRVAPTERVDGQLLQGIVHDPTARAMGGVAGHAGLFSTAADIARFCRMLLGRGELEGVRVLRPESVAAMTQPQTDGSDRRGLGWDIDSRYSGPRGAWFPAGRSYGHTGWTGTSLWIDPDSQSFVILLGNRVHPSGRGDVLALRRLVGTLAAEAIGRDAGAPLNGIDVLLHQQFAPLRGLTVGLITNHSGRDRLGRSTIDLLHTAPGVTLRALFSPEHGIRGTADEKVGDSTDPRTGLPIYSLYGDTPRRAAGQSSADYDLAVIRSRAPKPEQLAGLDALVIDLQDIGARFYTYASTVGATLEVAAQQGKKVFVLDRVNPIGGAVEGPVLTRPPSFIGYHPIPVRHGLTLGELARLFNRERQLGADLQVIACARWQREQYYDDTGLPWVNPSPSMRSLTAALLYPGFCLLEGTSVSMGRGTAAPFEQVGAPYIDGVRLAAELNAAGLPGVRFEPVTFTPTAPFYPGPVATLKYHDRPCGGVRAVITDRAQLRPVEIGLELALLLRRLYPADFNVQDMARLLGDDATLRALAAGEPRATIVARWQPALAHFRERIRPALLYP